MLGEENVNKQITISDKKKRNRKKEKRVYHILVAEGKLTT